MYKVYSSCGFQQGDDIGITSLTCRHCTLSNSIICSDSYPIPILSFIPSLYPLLFNSKNFYFLVSFLFLLHACMYSHQVYNSNGGLAPKIGLVLGQNWMVISMNQHSPVVCKCISPLYNVYRLRMLLFI